MKRYMVALATALFLCGCSSDDAGTSEPVVQPLAIHFDTSLRDVGETRATYPDPDWAGTMTLDRLKVTTYGVFAQHTSNTTWTGYTKTTPFNFMWNQQVEWESIGSVWTYSPVKYWPNDNNPADDQTPAAQGSLAHSYLSFFAYAPYQAVADAGTGFNVKDVDSNSDGTPDHDGIVAVSANDANANAAHIYYRTSLENPFGVDESVDLLWATNQNCYKYDVSDANDQGRVGDRVPLVFKHALSKLAINAKALVDRTSTHSSEAYSDDVDANTRIFIETVSITTPDYYPEGKLMMAPDAIVPTWDYTGLTALKKTGFSFDSTTGNSVEDVRYAMRYASPNIPQNHAITDSNSDGMDDETGLTAAETVKADFDNMTEGVTRDEQQVAANHSFFVFPPSTDTEAISATVVYHVVTYDPHLSLNNPKYYSHVTNNITATLTNDDFHFEPNKQYKILLNLGVTSVKFEVQVLNELGEYILLSSVVKEWDTQTQEVNVE